MNVGIWVITNFMLFLAAAIWQCKEAFTPPNPESDDKNEDDFEEVSDY